MTTASLSYHRIGNLTNPYTNEPVKKSRDCTEIEPKIGAQIAKMFDIPFRDPNITPEPFILQAYSKLHNNPEYLGI